MIKYNDQDLFVTYLANDLSYVLVTKNESLDIGLFKVNLSDLPDYEESIKNKFLKFRKLGSY
jgi:hypothetical protein